RRLHPPAPLGTPTRPLTPCPQPASPCPQPVQPCPQDTSPCPQFREHGAGSVRPFGRSLLQERRHPLTCARQLRRRRHHFERDGVRILFRAVQLGIQRLLAERLRRPTTPRGTSEEIGDRVVQLRVGHHTIDQPPFQRRRRVDGVTGQGQFHEPLTSHGPRHRHRRGVTE